MLFICVVLLCFFCVPLVLSLNINTWGLFVVFYATYESLFDLWHHQVFCFMFPAVDIHVSLCPPGITNEMIGQRVVFVTYFLIAQAETAALQM